ncbi:hypothetical protein N9N67_07375 [Bacteriovoracaceae bacterium]|nr:hypothetical protein [Bacteriovoracaceae bacterium]
MKKLLLFLTMSAFLNIGFSNEVITKSFEVKGYACFQNTLDAMSGSIIEVKTRAKAWCEDESGQLNFNLDPKEIELKVHAENSPHSGGCPGDVTLKATFECLI